MTDETLLRLVAKEVTRDPSIAEIARASVLIRVEVEEVRLLRQFVAALETPAPILYTTT